MTCPYCDKKMERGYLKSSSLINWGKEEALGYYPEDLRLTKNPLKGFFKGNFAEAYHCSSCKKLVVSLEESQR